MNVNIAATVSEIAFPLGAICLAVGFAFIQFRRGKNDASKELNETLNELLKARDTKIADLDGMLQEQGKKIAYLEGQVKTLQTQKSDMENLIKTSLKEHFIAHPDLALELKKKMTV